MIASEFVWFGIMLGIWLTLLAWVKLRWPDSSAGRMIATIA